MREVSNHTQAVVGGFDLSLIKSERTVCAIGAPPPLPTRQGGGPLSMVVRVREALLATLTWISAKYTKTPLKTFGPLTFIGKLTNMIFFIKALNKKYLSRPLLRRHLLI